METEIQAKIREWLKDFGQDEAAPLVIVPGIATNYEAGLECLDSLLAHTRPKIPLLLLDEAEADPRLAATLETLPGAFLYIRLNPGQTLLNAINSVLETSAPRDIIIVGATTIVPEGWLERLQAAALSRSTVATATPFSNSGGFLSVPYRNRPIPNLVKGLTAAQVDARIEQAASTAKWPLLPTALEYCSYYRRAALDVVGPFDTAFAWGYGATADFSQRSVAAGFYHVLADNLFVFNNSAADQKTPPEEKQRREKAAQTLLQKRYPWYEKALADAAQEGRNPLALALERARAALLGYRVAIDATALDGFTTGAQVLVLELIRALAALPTPRKHLAVIIRDDVPEKVLQGLEKVVDEVIRAGELEKLEQPRFDLVHRPYQIYSADALNLLKKAARRFIVSHLDFINHSNPTYFSRPEDWLTFQELTRATFASADGLMFISQDAAEDAAQQGLSVPEERVCVSYVGIDHQVQANNPAPPAESAQFKDKPFILMIGHNLKHKNRAYAIRLFNQLLQTYEWPGQLVFIGPNVVWGGSGGDEALLRLQHPLLRERLHYLGAVGEAEKQWLVQNAALVLYPSIAEGFGLIPFEAAATSTPALTTRTTSLGEVLGEHVKYVELLDLAADAQTAWTLISDPASAAKQIAAIQARAALFTWDKVAAKTWDFYESIIQLPPRQLNSGGGELLSEKRTHAEIQKLQQEYAKLEDWANGMSGRLTGLEKKPLYRLLARFKLL